MIKEKAKYEKLMKEVQLLEGVTASLNDNFLIVKGPAGEARRLLSNKNILIKIEGNKISFESQRATKQNKKLLGSLIAHVRNMMKGSTQQHVYALKICSGHFPMNVSISGGKLSIKNFLGEKVPRTLQLKNGADLKIEGDTILITSTNKEIAGQVAADIEQLTRRPRYDTRIFQDGIYITSKDGKELK